MKGYVNRDYQPLNEYTTPICMEPEYTNIGVIKAIGTYGEKYSVAKIEYQTFFNEEYQYIFTPYWDVIDALDTKVFQGIPGITMELRLEKYYRVNMQPVFITERSPSPKREDLWELMESVGLDYYDRFEWLIRTPLRCGNDNLIVERYQPDKQEIYYQSEMEVWDEIGYGSTVRVACHNAISSHPMTYTERMLKLLAAGVTVHLEEEGIVIDQQNRSDFLSMLRMQYYGMRRVQDKKRQEGVEKAKKEGKYVGRKPIVVEKEQLNKVAHLFWDKKITESQAMERLGLSSRSTFYRKIKSLRDL